MSLKDFFSKVEADAAKVIHALETDVEQFGTWLETIAIPTVIGIVDAGKAVVDFDSSDLIGDLIGRAGSPLEDRLRTILDSSVFKLQAAQQFISEGNSNQVLAKTLQWIATQVPATQTAFWNELMSMITADLADGKVSLSEALALINYVEKNKV